VLGGGVDGGDQGACPDTDSPAEDGEQGGFGEELQSDVAFRGAE
jgi:hypothetical protein